MTYPSPKRNMVLKAVLMRSCLVSLTTAKPVNTAQLRTMVNSARPMTNVFNKAHSTVRRPTKNKTTTKNSNSNQRINTVRGNNVNTARPKAVFNAVKGNQVYAVNTSACNSTAERIWVKINAVRHNRLIPTIYISCMEHFWTTAKVKTVNGEVQLHGPSYDEEDHHYRVRLHNKNRVKGSQCPLILTTPTINSYHTTSQPQKTQKPKKPKRKNTEVPQPSGSTEYVADGAVNEEMDDSLVRAATTTSSLEAEQDSVMAKSFQSFILFFQSQRGFLDVFLNCFGQVVDVFKLLCGHGRWAVPLDKGLLEEIPGGIIRRLDAFVASPIGCGGSDIGLA
ncbi:hypothetical protein Tco_1446776 [Tanacetum coccineum]